MTSPDFNALHTPAFWATVLHDRQPSHPFSRHSVPAHCREEQVRHYAMEQRS